MGIVCKSMDYKLGGFVALKIGFMQTLCIGGYDTLFNVEGRIRSAKKIVHFVTAYME